MATINDKFFALLRYSVLAEETSPLIEDGKWPVIFTLAERHSLVGIIFQGVQRSGQKPPQALVFQWISDSERIKGLNQRANLVAVEVTRLFEENGFRSCILKGQGNALLYDVRSKKEEGRSLALLRQPGDIDVWVRPKAEVKGDVKKQILEFVNSKWPGQEMRYHHVEIPPIKGVPIEVHFMPTYMRNPIYNKRLQKWFSDQADEQFSHHVTLPDCEDTISIPTVAFNCIYQLQHMFSHLFTEGFGLRQVTDYYYVLRRIEDPLRLPLYKGKNLEEMLKYLGLLKFAGAMMWVMQRVYQLDSKYFITEPNQKEGEFLLKEILQSGNMGYYDTRLGHKRDESIAHRYFRMTIRNMRFIKHYPSEALCEPIFRTWYFFKKKSS